MRVAALSSRELCTLRPLSALSRIAPLLAAYALTACTTAATPAPNAALPAAAESSPAAAVPTHRLPNTVQPKRYRLELWLDPAREGFEGEVTIDATLHEPTRTVWLNARGLEVTLAQVEHQGRQHPAGIEAHVGADPRAEPDVLSLSLPTPLQGPVELRLRFAGKYRHDLRGLYQLESGGRQYAFTQFEPMDARSAFPCFDEPSFKVPFQLTLHAPQGQLAVSNMPEVARTEEKGWTRFNFAPSPPMPSYLVAFGVGPLETLTLPEHSASTPRVRLVTAHGKSSRGELALQLTQQQLELLEGYFGSPYPYRKLDIVAVPEFAAGAMENPGLVTFREELLLVTAESSVEARRRATGVIAHELAHMWFGDWVTMQWWDDLWLNEAFATWMSTKTVSEFAPELAADEAFLRWLSVAMEQDSEVEARAIVQPVKTQTDAFRAFSGITYAKGASVLTMVEHWLGVNRFRAGIQRYLEAHQFGNATSEDLYRALGSGTQPVSDVMLSFTTQPGVPLIHMNWSCEDDELSVQVRQERYQPLGPQLPRQQWQLPVCYSFLDAGQRRTECLLLSQAKAAHAQHVSSCPPWVAPNTDRNGYYYSQLSSDAMKALGQATQLSAKEQVGWMMDAQAMLRSGAWLAPTYLADAARFLLQVPTRPTGAWTQFLDAATWFDAELLPSEQRAPYQRWLASALQPQIERMGLSARTSETAEQQSLRGQLLLAAGLTARSPAIIAWARQESLRWLEDPGGTDPELAHAALPIAASLGEPQFFDGLLRVTNTTEVAEHRTMALRALGETRNPEQAEALLRWVLSGKIRTSDYPYLLIPLLRQRDLRPLTERWFEAHIDQLLTELPLFSIRRYVEAALARCDLSDRDSLEKAYRPKLAKLEGLDGILESSRNQARRCAALRAHNEEALAETFGPK